MANPTEIHVSQILPGTAYQLVGTNSGATKDVYLTLSGTSNQVNVNTAGTTITLSTPQNINSGASPTFASETLTNTTNQLVLGTTTTTTISATAPVANRVYTIPDAGTASSFVLDHGNYTIAGTWTFSSALTITPTTNQLVLGTTRTVTISATQPATTSRTYTIPDQGAAANFVLDQSNYTIAGTWTFTPNTTFTAGLTSTGAITATNQNITVLNIILTGVTSNPGSPSAGQLWYRSDTAQFMGYNGTNTVILG